MTKTLPWNIQALRELWMNTDLTISNLLTTICGKTNGIKPSDLRSKRRTQRVSLARNVAMYLLYKRFGLTLDDTGRFLHRDHTTVIHAYEKIKRCLNEDTLLAQEIDQIKTILYGDS